MKYFKIMFDDENAKKDDMICFADKCYEEKYGIKQYDLNNGQFIKNWNSEFTFYYDENKGNIPIDFMASNIGWTLISPKFKQTLEKFEDKGIQYLAAKIKEAKTGSEVIGYSVINITTFTDALDLDNSDYFYLTVKKTGQKVLCINKFALKGRSLQGKHIVKIKEDAFSTFISEELKNEICKQKLRGCDFLEVKIV